MIAQPLGGSLSAMRAPAVRAEWGGVGMAWSGAWLGVGVGVACRPLLLLRLGQQQRTDTPGFNQPDC